MMIQKNMWFLKQARVDYIVFYYFALFKPSQINIIQHKNSD